MDIFLPTNALKRLLFPTLGRQTMRTYGFFIQETNKKSETDCREESIHVFFLLSIFLQYMKKNELTIFNSLLYKNPSEYRMWNKKIFLK